MVRMGKQKTKEKKMTQVIKYNDKEYKLPLQLAYRMIQQPWKLLLIDSVEKRYSYHNSLLLFMTPSLVLNT
jgi:hypothetical protein